MNKTLHLIASSDVSTTNGAFYRSFENFNLYELPTSIAQSVVVQPDIFKAYYDWVSSLEFNGVEEAINDAKEHLDALAKWLETKTNMGAILDWDVY